MSLTSIIIPARDEEKNIKETISGIQREFNQHHYEYEVIVIDDGSRDNTAEIVASFAGEDKRIKLIKNNQVHGVGYAIKKGLDNFKGEYVIIVMADSSDDPRDMIRYLKEVGKGYDCCFGTRWKNGAVVRGYPVLKRMLNRLANYGINILFGLRYTDITNAFKCYSRKTIEGIKPILSGDFNITVELPLKAIIRGYTYSVILTDWHQRRNGKSSLKIQEVGSRYCYIIMHVLIEKLRRSLNSRIWL